MKIISHSADADGIISAMLVAKRYDITNEDDFILTDYGKNTDWFSKIDKDEPVVICDFSFENGPEDMKKLTTKTKKIIWIDHHKSSIEKYKELEDKCTIPGLRQDGTAACMLTYLYFFGGKNNNIKVEDYELAPKFVRLAHDYDVWRYQYGEETEFFNLGWQAYGITSPLDSRLSDLFDEKELDKLLSIGKACKAFRDSNGRIACNDYGFEVELEGKKGFALNNCIKGGSTWFGDIINKYDFVCAFLYMGKEKQWEYSFYSNSTNGCDCAKLAQSINPKGGGHEHAAGCTLDRFIFDK